MQGKCDACRVAYRWKGAPSLQDAYCPRCKGKLTATAYILKWQWLEEQPVVQFCALGTDGAQPVPRPKPMPKQAAKNTPTGGEIATGVCPVCHAKVENDYGVVACSDHREQVKKARRAKLDVFLLTRREKHDKD